MRVCLLGALLVGLSGCGMDEELARARREKAVAEQAAVEARSAAERAAKELQEAHDVVERLQRDLDEYDKRITSALDAIAIVDGAADRAAAVAKLKALQAEKAEMDLRIRAAKDRAEGQAHRRSIPITKECQANPLAKGCM